MCTRSLDCLSNWTFGQRRVVLLLLLCLPNSRPRVGSLTRVKGNSDCHSDTIEAFNLSSLDLPRFDHICAPTVSPSSQELSLQLCSLYPWLPFARVPVVASQVLPHATASCCRLVAPCNCPVISSSFTSNHPVCACLTLCHIRPLSLSCTCSNFSIEPSID